MLKKLDKINNNIFFKKIKPIIIDNHNFLINNCLTNYIAYYIANEYLNNILTNDNIEKIYKSALEDFINVNIKDCKTEKINKILKQKYKLEIITINPLKIKKLK